MGKEAHVEKRSNGIAEAKDLLWTLGKIVQSKVNRITVKKFGFTLVPGEIATYEQYECEWQSYFNDSISALRRRSLPLKSEIVRSVWEHGMLEYYSPTRPRTLDAAYRLMGDGYYTRDDAMLYTRILYACRWYQRGYVNAIHLARSFGIIVEHFIDRFDDLQKLRHIFMLEPNEYPGIAISKAIFLLARNELNHLGADTHDFVFREGDAPRMLEIGDISTIFANTHQGRRLVNVTVVGFDADGRIKVVGNSEDDQRGLREGKKLDGVLPTDFSRHGPRYTFPCYALARTKKVEKKESDDVVALRRKYSGG